jgi:hypothetical protein
MDMRKLFLLSCLIFSIVVGYISPAAGVTLGTDPTFIVSSMTGGTVVYTTARDPRETARFSGNYYDGSVQNLVPIPGNGVYDYTGSLVTSSGGYTGLDLNSAGPSSSQSTYDMTANAGTFQAEIDNHATSTNANAFVNTLSGIGKWFVLTGPADPVSLSVDILFQGQIMADNTDAGGNTGAFFTHYVGFVPQADLYPDGTLTQENIIAFGGRPDDAPPGTAIPTVPDFTFTRDGTYYDINVIIRSNPFTVTPGVPFRLNMNLNAAAFAENYDLPGTLEAHVDFLDPQIATSFMFPDIDVLTFDGFIVNIDGMQLPLSDFGYAVAAANVVPEPSTFLLFGAGLAGLGLMRRRFKK